MNFDILSFTLSMVLQCSVSCKVFAGATALSNICLHNPADQLRCLFHRGVSADLLCQAQRAAELFTL